MTDPAHGLRNALRERLDSTDHACGVFVSLEDPAVVELAALAGFDFALVDLEHTTFGLATLAGHVRAAKAHAMGVLVRVPDDDAKFILRVLETGADGILVPHVCDRRSAEAAVDAVRYPPIGHRGFYDGTAAAGYFSHGFPDYSGLADHMNRTVVLVCLIEDRAGVEHCEEIVATPGVDAVIVGPADLSLSLGHGDVAEHPTVVDAIERVRSAARQAGVGFGGPVGHPMYKRSATELRAAGDCMLLMSSDCGLLMSALRTAVKAGREA
jgi:4-hydroxy-2-oxoheptanedioate aldolase